jgi:hypothetical protein
MQRLLVTHGDSREILEYRTSVTNCHHSRANQSVRNLSTRKSYAYFLSVTKCHQYIRKSVEPTASPSSVTVVTLRMVW